MKRTGQAHKQYSFFLGTMLCGYSLADKMYGAVFIVLMSMRGIDPLQISIIFAVSSLSLAIFDYPSGNLSDLYGRKRLTAIGFIIWGGGLTVFAFAGNLAVYIVSAVVMSLGVALISGSPQAWYLDKLDDLGMPEYKNVALPRLNGYVSAFAVAGALLASLSSNIYLYLPVAIAGAVAVGLGLYVWLRFSDNYGVRTEDGIFKEVYITTIQFARNKLMRFILLKSIFSHAALLAFLLSWQVYGVNELGLPTGSLGGLLTVFMAVISLSSFCSSFLVKRRIPAVRIICTGMVISAAGLLLAGLSAHPVIFIAGLILYEFGLGLEFSLFSAWVQDFIPRGKRATFTSGLSALQSLAGFAVTLLLGVLAERFGYTVIWMLGAASVMLSMMVLLFLNKRYIGADQTHAEAETAAG
ncbi:MFS transporter [Paenibacillus camerounensis]|uniref:MFS transporter n=1 Tax=Paenibacillus camerounensis TaxID=1243663 RepID=UPI0005A81D4D|nr:MFS transporter [Paenibacillus camerounensis]